jgi:hypothetical protein
VIDAVASDYLDRITFVAVAQNSTPEESAKQVGVWFSPERLRWGYSDEIGPLYGVRGQPVSVLVTSRGKVADTWFGPRSEAEIREALDRLIALSA